MVTSTTLRHSKVRTAIIKACLNVFKNGYCVDHVRNRDDDAYLAIRKGRDGTIVALTRDGRNVSDMVKAVVREETARLRSLKQ